MLSVHAVVEEGKRRATGGCQLREREGHHLLRGEQHDCLRLPGLHGAKPSAGSRKSLKHFSTPRRGEAGRCSGSRMRICLASDKERKCLTYCVLYCQNCVTPNRGGGRRLQDQEKRF